LLGGCAVALVLAGSGQESTADGGGVALSYLPTRGAVVVAVSTDFRSQQFRDFDRRVVRRVLRSGTERLLRLGFGDGGLKGSYARDVSPQLGSDFVLAMRVAQPEGPAGMVGALQVKDPVAARRFIERQKVRRDGSASGATLYSERRSREAFLALEGDVVVVADSERRLRRALTRHDKGNGLTEAGFARRLGDLPHDALVKVFGDLRPAVARRPLRRFTRLPWVRGVHSFAATLGMGGPRLQLDGQVKTDPAKLTDDQLPIEAGDSPPPIVRRAGRISGASQNQSRTTLFLLRAARAGYPRSRFVRDVARLERRLGIDFEKDVLAQFDGPSASLLALDGSFAARSAVKDPQLLAATIRRLAPDLGRLVEDLQRLDSASLGLLLLLAPDAPAMPGVLGKSHVTVRHLRGQPDFYRVSSSGPARGLNDFYFGLEGGVFVIGSSERRAKAMAHAPAQAPTDLRGGSVTDTDLVPLRRTIKRTLGFDLGALGRMAGSLNANRERLRGSLSIELR
jgi:hypothetical protein